MVFHNTSRCKIFAVIFNTQEPEQQSNWLLNLTTYIKHSDQVLLRLVIQAFKESKVLIYSIICHKGP
jgi:hypothetical protein